jgi:hypothetical protein
MVLKKGVHVVGVLLYVRENYLSFTSDPPRPNAQEG